MYHANVLRWIKKAEEVWKSREMDYRAFELDELYWFVKRKERTETRENTYIMMIAEYRAKS